MRRLRKPAVIILGILIAGGILVFLGFTWMEKKTKDAIEKQVNVEIDMAQVVDGTYRGTSDGGMVQVEVEVQVENHAITNITLVKHENGKGKPAESILDEMIEENTYDVDVVSGATISSKTIKNAVNVALQNGIVK